MSNTQRFLVTLVLRVFFIIGLILIGIGIGILSSSDSDKLTENGAWFMAGGFTLCLLEVIFVTSLDVAKMKKLGRADDRFPPAEKSEFRKRQETVNNDQWLHDGAPPPIGEKRQE